MKCQCVAWSFKGGCNQRADDTHVNGPIYGGKGEDVNGSISGGKGEDVNGRLNVILIHKTEIVTGWERDHE